MGQILYRGVYMPLEFTRDGLLLTHKTLEEGCTVQDVVTGAITTTPLVHPDDWMVVARTVFWEVYHNKKINLFDLLHIDSDLVRELKNESNPALSHGEYFGMVPKEAIVSQERYSWAKTGRHVNDVPEGLVRQYPQVFAFSEGFELVKQ